MAQFSQVSGEDEIVFIRARAGVLKESGEGVIGCGGHGRSHVVGVRDSLVHHLSTGDVGDIGAGAAAAQDRAACGGGSPLR